MSHMRPAMYQHDSQRRTVSTPIAIGSDDDHDYDDNASRSSNEQDQYHNDSGNNDFLLSQSFGRLNLSSRREGGGVGGGGSMASSYGAHRSMLGMNGNTSASGIAKSFPHPRAPFLSSRDSPRDHLSRIPQMALPESREASLASTPVQGVQPYGSLRSTGGFLSQSPDTKALYDNIMMPSKFSPSSYDPNTQHNHFIDRQEQNSYEDAVNDSANFVNVNNNSHLYDESNINNSAHNAIVYPRSVPTNKELHRHYVDARWAERRNSVRRAKQQQKQQQYDNHIENGTTTNTTSTSGYSSGSISPQNSPSSRMILNSTSQLGTSLTAFEIMERSSSQNNSNSSMLSQSYNPGSSTFGGGGGGGGFSSALGIALQKIEKDQNSSITNNNNDRGEFNGNLNDGILSDDEHNRSRGMPFGEEEKFRSNNFTGMVNQHYSIHHQQQMSLNGFNDSEEEEYDDDNPDTVEAFDMD